MSHARISRIALGCVLAVFFALPSWAQTAAAPPAAAPAAPAGAKKRVAVMNFDYGTVRTTVAQIFGTDQDVGKGISDMLVEKLVNGGQYSVIERSALDKILKEQNFSNSDRATPTRRRKSARCSAWMRLSSARSRSSAGMTSTPMSAAADTASE